MIRNVNDMLREAQRSLEQIARQRREVYKKELDFYRPILSELGLSASVPEVKVSGKRYEFSVNGKVYELSVVTRNERDEQHRDEIHDHRVPTPVYAALALAAQEAVHKHLARCEGELNAAIKKLED